MIAWANKWHDKEVISEEEKEWIIPKEVRPANVYANPKAHRRDLPYRYIISAKGSATENLARWIEIKLKKFSGMHPAYLEDTRHFLRLIEDINIRKGPLDELNTVLVTRNIADYYPSCDTKKCIEAVEWVLNEAEESSVADNRSILEAVELTMTSNNCSFLGRHFTQIDGATIGGPAAGSITDILGAKFIDKVIYEECPYGINEYKRYRDDTIDVSSNTSIDQRHVINKWLNDNTYKGKIKFKMDCDPSTIPFLDVRVNFINGFLLTETYSKETDIHQYLNPLSCHPLHIFRSIPKALGIRIRRNCSDRYENDSKFIESLREFKGYLVTSGYDSKVVHKEFSKLATLPRKKFWISKETAKKEKRQCEKILICYSI